MLLLLEKMLRLFDFVVSEGGPVGVVWRMLANTIPEYLGLGIPIGLMLGILLAFRRLALSSEIGRASCRERVCQYVWISVVAGSLQKKSIVGNRGRMKSDSSYYAHN